MAVITNLDTTPPLAAGTNQFQSIVVSFLRENDTTAYTALDVIASDSGAAESIEFPNCGYSGAVISVSITNRLETDTITPRLWLFDAAPTNFADNAAFALVTADIPKIIGFLDFVDGDKTLIGTLINYYIPTDQSDGDTGSRSINPMPYTTASGSLYGILQTVAGYTPISGTQFTIKLGIKVD